MMRRLLAGMTAAATLSLTAVGLTAAPASATVSTVSTPTVMNTATAQAETVTTTTPSTAYTTGSVVQITGPDASAQTPTYDFTGTATGTPSGCTPVTCTGSSVAATLDLVTNNLPAAPGAYTLSVCPGTTATAAVTCTTTQDTGGALTVQGAAPAPSALTTSATTPGASDTAASVTGTGFADGDTVAFTKSGAAATGITFTPSYSTSTATVLKGTLALTSAVAAGTYDMTVKGSDNQTGTKAGALVVTAAGGGGGGTGTTGISPTTLPNTTTATVLTITTATPGAYTTPAGVSVQLAGPGVQTPDFDVDATAVDTPSGCTPAVTCTGSVVTTSPVNLVTNGLPAAPGAYTYSVCVGPASGDGASCNAAPDTGALPVTGAAPAPTSLTTTATKDGDSDSTASITGTGFADGDVVTFSQGGTAVSGITFTPSYSTSTATLLKGTLAVGSSVPDGAYDVTVTDTTSPTAQKGTKAGAFVIGAAIPAVTDLTATPTGATTANLSFTAPTPASGTTLTGYSIVVSTSPTATSTDSGVTVNQTGTATTATVTGLTAGTEYYVTVTPTGSTGGTSAMGTPASVTFYSPAATALTLKESATHLVYPGKLTLSGALTRTDPTTHQSVPLSGATVYLFTRIGSAKAVPFAKVTTGATGAYTDTLVPSVTARYYAIYLGSASTSTGPGNAFAAAAAPTVTVAQLVKAHATHATVTKHQTLVVTGSVSPADKGATVRLAYVVGSGRHLVAKAVVGSKSTFRFATKKLTAGHTYHLVVISPKNARDAAGVSHSFTVKRKK